MRITMLAKGRISAGRSFRYLGGMNRFVLPLTLLIALALPASAQTAFEPVATRIRGQALNLPAETPLVSLTPADKASPRQVYTINRSFAADGTFITAWKSPRYESTQTFRADGTVLTSKLVDLASGNSVAVETDEARTTIRTVVSEKKGVKSDKKSALKPGIALREELAHLNLQAWTYGIRDGLKFQSLSPDGGMAGDFQILFVGSVDPTKLSEKYAYPAEFKAALAGRGPFTVADMSLQGVGAFFYPHHFYLIYTAGPSGLQFVGYFGEDPKNPIFQYVPKQ